MRVNVGTAATFTVTATGNPAPAYQWSLNGTVIGGATASAYKTAATTLAMNGGSYTVVATNSVGSITSSAAILTVDATPTITRQPQSQTVNVGTAATFSVTATGDPTLSYQWSLNGAPIAGADAPAYTTAAAALAMNGGTYTVTVTSPAGSVTSSAAILTVDAVSLAIDTQPSSVTVNIGTAATFTVAATGNPAPAYQWSLNGSGIGGATAAVYTTAASTLAMDGGSYTVTVTNSAGSITSSAAILTVDAAPTITSQPSSVTVSAGTAADFTVTATGDPAPTYQWSLNGTAIAGATAPAYSTAATILAMSGGSYTVTATNGLGSVTSSAAILTVDAAPSITTQPQSQTVLSGTAATFTVTASGDPMPVYQWSLDGTAITGATAPTYTTPATTYAMNGGRYTVTVTNGLGSVTSPEAILTVDGIAPSILIQPSSQSVLVGATATFTFACAGTPAPSYQWYEGAFPIAGAISSSYTSPATTLAMNGSSYSCTATNFAGSVTSSAASLTVATSNLTAPVFTTQPQDQLVTAPATATFTAAASGNPAPTYQWYLGITAIPLATSASYTTPATTTAMSGGNYTVVATNSEGNVTSNAAILTVNPPGTGMEGIYCGTFTVNGTSTPMIAAVTAAGEFRFTITNDWVGSATLSGSTGSGTLYTARGATPNSLSLTNVVISPGVSITGSYAYGTASGVFSLASATDPNTGVVLYNHPTMTLPVTGWTTTTGGNVGWQSSVYPWTAVSVDASGNIAMTVNTATVTGTLTQLASGSNLYRMNLTFPTSGNFTGLGWYSGSSYSGPAGGYGWPLTFGIEDGFFANALYCILSTVPGNPTYNLGLAAAVTYPY